MIELGKETVVDYLIERGLLKTGETAVVEELGGGVSNVVLKITTSKDRFVLKQALPQLRVKDEWFSTVERIFLEKACLEVLARILPRGSVPEVLFCDPENYLFLMTSAPEGSVVWKDQLLRGQVDLGIAAQVGDLLAIIHNKTAGDPAVREQFPDHRNFIELRVDPYHWTVAKRHPDVGRAVEEEVGRMLETKLCLVHGDYSPKNILVSGRDLLLLDCEVAHYGDPVFDIAFCLNHLLLKAIKNHRLKEAHFQAAFTFWEAYFQAIRLSSQAALMRSTLRELGILMLARIDGKSPVEYIKDEPTKDLVRAISKTIIQGRYEGLQEIVELIAERLQTERFMLKGSS